MGGIRLIKNYHQIKNDSKNLWEIISSQNIIFGLKVKSFLLLFLE